MPLPTFGTQTNGGGYDLAVSIFASLDPEFLDVVYPDLLWQKVFTPELRSANVPAGAREYVRMMKERTGAAAFLSNLPGGNVPRVSLGMSAMKVPLAVSGIAAGTRATG